MCVNYSMIVIMIIIDDCDHNGARYLYVSIYIYVYDNDMFFLSSKIVILHTNNKPMGLLGLAERS